MPTRLPNQTPTHPPAIIPSEYPHLPNPEYHLSNPHRNPHTPKWTTETFEAANPLSTTLPPESEDATVRALACAAWAIVLALYTGREDACFGVLSVGEDARYVAVRTCMVSCARTVTVRDLVDRVTEDQDLEQGHGPRDGEGGSDINEPNQDTSGLLPLRNYLAFGPGLRSTTTSADWLSPAIGALLVLSLAVRERTVSLRAHFDSRVVGSEEIRHVMRLFAETFRQITSPEHQDSTLRDLDLRTPEDKSLLNSWNAKKLEPVHKPLHVLFEESARANPGRMALIFHGREITYGELNTLSDDLAHRIMQAGDLFADGDFIPVSIEKSPEMVIAMLGVLKAGRAFVPIDRAYPEARREYIFAAVRARGVLLSETVYDLEVFDFTLKELDTLDTIRAGKGLCRTTHNHHHAESVDPTQPAYVLFTSGSTGVPKGVVLEHRNVSTAMQELGRQFGLNHSTRMLQYTSSTFDPSVLEIFGTLIHGGAVCIPTETQRLNDIPAAINEMQVNTAVFVPSVLKLLRPEQIPAVEKLIIGGEALPKALVDLWAPRTRLINAYGPTETCVCSVANLRVAPGGYAGSIGTPIACRAWVVDPCNPRRLMPVGAVGELWIEGPTVARGYLDNEAATKASFFSPLPWSAGGTGGDGGDGDDPARVLRTGDLVRYLPDGTLVFLGRKDKQIKLDGHRIELEEIEAVICRSAFVSGASVQLVETANSSPTLAAFIVPADVDCRSEDSGEILDQGRNNGHIIGRLRGLLQAQLPARMVPQNMIAVTCIPRMTSGKVDQRRLTALFEDEVRLSHHHAACRSKANCTLDLNELPETYTAMRDLWAIALEIPPHHICANARFLHLGGNSIKAMKLVAAARSSGLSLTVNDVLTNTYTLDEMARRVGKPAAIREPIPAEPLVTTQAQTPSRSRRAYTPTWIQTVSLTTVGAFPEGNYTRIILDLRGPLDLTRLREAIQSLVTRNEILRTQYSLKDDGSGIEATVLDAGEISTPLIRFNSLSEAVESWESVPATCFNRQLAEFSYVVTDKASTRFALGLQHSQYDAWTVPLVLRQLQSLYHVPQAGTQYHHPSQSLPPPGPPFSEYATRLARESNPEAQRFWKEQLAGVSMTILGNTDKNGSADEPDGHFQRSVHLPHSRFTPATIIYTAWALVLSRHAQNTNPNPNPNPNSRKILFGSAVSGRNIDMPGILNVVGPCINMIPFAVSVDISEPRNRCTGATCTSACTYIDALQSVQNAMLATVPYEAMPLPEIIARCTDWDPAGVFGSIVQHLDIGFGIPLLAPSVLSAGNAEATIEDSGSRTETGTGTGTGNATRALEWKFLETRKRYGRCRATDIYIFSSTTATTTTTPSTSTSTSDEGDSTSNTTVDVQMKYNPSHIAPALAGVLFAELCGHIEAMRRDPAEAILENGL